MDTLHPSGIYEIRNIVNGKRYVGSAVNFGNRWRQHAQSLQRGDHHSRALQRAWHKYTPRAFQFNKLLVCAKENLILYEQAALDALKPEYNCAPRAGSQLGFKMHEAARANMRAARRKDFSPMTGKTHSEATKAKISASRKGKGGGLRTPERLAKISAALKGREVSAEMRAKISATLTGHKQSPEQIEKRKANMPAGHYDRVARAKSKVSDDWVRVIRRYLSEGHSQSAISRLLGINPSIISRIHLGLSYDWVRS